MNDDRQFQRVGLVAKGTSEEAGEAAREVAEWLERRGLEAVLSPRQVAPGGTPPFGGDRNFDLVVVLGGDGTLLATARALPRIPILGGNLGTLGFLTEVSRSELYPSLVEVLEGRFEIEERALLDAEHVTPDGRRSGFRILNDAVITKGALARIIELTVRVDGHLVARFRSDGVIISSPTGSTAYNLSAGGPIVVPQLPVVVVTPICPHTLTLRPVVIPASSRVEVTLETSREEVFLTLDGQEGEELAGGDVVAVELSREVVHLVKVSGRTFYDSLRGKLRWGGGVAGVEPPTKT
ncbi:MAG: NAD(+)/NADH kinase [Acidobacteriota bacterium]